MTKGLWAFMLRSLLVTCCLSIVFLSGCSVKSVVDSSAVLANEAGKARINEQSRQVLRHGDWIVIRGITGPDNFIATVTNSPLSHAAIYDADNDEIIEADSTGVHTTPLNEFLGKAYRVIIIRPMWAQSSVRLEQNGETSGNDSHASQAVERARSWIGKPYNYTGLVGISLPDRYYCTQLVLRAYDPFITDKPDNPIPLVIEPGQMYHWGTIIYDSGPDK